jgi:hypothetical protein
MIDFWFAAIAWAVSQSIDPVDETTGRFFVNLGPNTNDIRSFEEWRSDLLTVLAVRDFGADSADITDTRKIIDLANRYAEAGASFLLDRLEQSVDLALPRLYVVAEILGTLVTGIAEQRSERSF